LKFLKSTLPAWPGHTEEELASRPDCFSIQIAKKRRLQLAENKARVREFLKRLVGAVDDFVSLRASSLNIAISFNSTQQYWRVFSALQVPHFQRLS
jgi:hypothetical protein